MKTQEAIAYAGSSAALAELIGVTPAAITQWGDYPPDGRQLQIEKLTRKALKAEPGCLDRLLGMDKLNPESV